MDERILKNLEDKIAILHRWVGWQLGVSGEIEEPVDAEQLMRWACVCWTWGEAMYSYLESLPESEFVTFTRH